MKNKQVSQDKEEQNNRQEEYNNNNNNNNNVTRNCAWKVKNATE